MEQTAPASLPASVDALQATLQKEMYVADRGLAMSIYLALRLRRSARTYLRLPTLASRPGPPVLPRSWEPNRYKLL